MLPLVLILNKYYISVAMRMCVNLIWGARDLKYSTIIITWLVCSTAISCLADCNCLSLSADAKSQNGAKTLLSVIRTHVHEHVAHGSRESY